MATHFVTFKMCLAHLHFKTKVCAKINLKTPFPTNFGIICRYHGNAHSTTVKKCVLHIYTSRPKCVPKLIWKHLFPQVLAYSVTMATHIPPVQKCVLHIYTSRPTSVPTFISNALFSSIFGIMCHYHGNTLSATVEKCVLHIYTQRQTSVPNSMRIGQKLRK